MAAKVVFVKEESSPTQSDGILAGIAQIHAVHSARDLRAVIQAKPAILLFDLTAPRLDAGEIVRALRRAKIYPVVLFLDCSQQPSDLLNQIQQVARLRVGSHSPSNNVGHLARVLKFSQETLARVLGVSGKTIQRWMKGTRPRVRSELIQLARLVSLLEDTFPTREAIQSYLNHPNPSFSGEKPINLLLRREFERIEGDLQAIQEGVYI